MTDIHVRRSIHGCTAVYVEHGMGFGYTGTAREDFKRAYGQARADKNYGGSWTPTYKEGIDGFGSHGLTWILYWKDGRVSQERQRK